MKRKLIIVFLVVILLLTSCSVPENPNSTEAPVSNTTAPTEEPTATPEPIKLITPSNDTEEMVFPFWQQNTMYDETLCMIEQSDGIYAKTLFTPTKIIKITDYTLKNEYKEGVDYTWDGTTNTIKWIEGSSIKYFTQNALKGLDENGKAFKTFDGEFDSNGCSRINGVLYSCSEFLYGKQISITYEYTPGSYTGYHAEYQGEYFTKLYEKLQNKEAITMVLYGDSIFEGMDSSQKWNRKPMQPSFGILMQRYLKKVYDTTIRLKNLSVGGKGSDYGLQHVDTVTNLSACDLVLVGWGTNDTCTGSQSYSNISKIVTKIREAFPDAAIIVCSTIHANDEANFDLNHKDISSELYKITELGCAYVDMYSVVTEVLKTKSFVETSGNNINHPNDWLIRLYAQNLLASFIKFE